LHTPFLAYAISQAAITAGSVCTVERLSTLMRQPRLQYPFTPHTQKADVSQVVDLRLKYRGGKPAGPFGSVAVAPG
jgi:hypothetical protein